MGFFSPKHKTFGWKSTEELTLMALEYDEKFEEKLTLGFKNDMTNLKNFNASSSNLLKFALWCATFVNSI